MTAPRNAEDTCPLGHMECSDPRCFGRMTAPAKHTPGSFKCQPPTAGPWTMEPRAQQRNAQPIKVAAAVILAPDGTRLADVRLAKDAALMVAAPDMLAALRAVESALNTRGRDDTLLIVVRAAIAKAEGRDK